MVHVMCVWWWWGGGAYSMCGVHTVWVGRDAGANSEPFLTLTFTSLGHLPSKLVPSAAFWRVCL